MASPYSKSKGRGNGIESFLQLPHNLLDSPAWNDLSLRARDCFIRLCRKHNGHNNGDMSLPLSELRNLRELRSPRSLSKALDELWSHGFIKLTREGGFGSQRICNLWAVTLWPICENRDKDIKAAERTDDWKQWKPDQPAPDYVEKFPKVNAKRKKQSGKISRNR